MGGQAFSSRPSQLNVVRLWPEQYIELRDQYQKQLLLFYERICTPPEAPQKPDHGDIDVLVEGPRHTFSRIDLAQALGAKDHLQVGNTSSFAIPLPGSDVTFFQLDVHLCKPSLFEWETTIYTHGDLWRILGMAANRLGFAINHVGLHIRIAEIDQTHPKDALLRLTSDPSEVMTFLGLDEARFKTGFEALDEIFAWATSSRLFRRKCFEKQASDGQSTKAERPMYADFVTRWLPQHPEVGFSEDDVRTARKALLEEALAKFDARDQYEHMVVKHRERLLKDAMWRKIAKALPLAGPELGKAMVALKTSMRWRDGCTQLYVEEEEVERVPALDERIIDDVVVPWVSEHWQQAVNLVGKGDGQETRDRRVIE
ncbi:MAG: hypothetical protein Q9218_001126 [Villophora microphyllina]